MTISLEAHLLQLITTGKLSIHDKGQFISRISKGHLTRDENSASHFCVYFAAYDPKEKMVFMGHHIKSGLWLFNGGHIDKGESLDKTLSREMSEEWGLIIKKDIHSPSLFTITEIENPLKQTCKLHYDVWYFIPCDKNTFLPSAKKLSKEFHRWGWFTVKDAKNLAQDTATRMALRAII